MKVRSKRQFLKVCAAHRMMSGPNLYDDLLSRYSEEHRKYHTIEHIYRMLRVFDRVRHMFKNVDEAELALWYHDVIYDIKKHDNEEQSARYFKNFALSFHCGLSPVFVRRVTKMILATRHKSISESPDARIICDIDLSILGMSPKIFDEYEKQIREEYNNVPESIYIKKRIEVLQRFLNREFIYSTKYFRRKYEEKARKNIQRSIRKLKHHLQS